MDLKSISNEYPPPSFTEEDDYLTTLLMDETSSTTAIPPSYTILPTSSSTFQDPLLYPSSRPSQYPPSSHYPPSGYDQTYHLQQPPSNFYLPNEQLSADSLLQSQQHENGTYEPSYASPYVPTTYDQLKTEPTYSSYFNEPKTDEPYSLYMTADPQLPKPESFQSQLHEIHHTVTHADQPQVEEPKDDVKLMKALRRRAQLAKAARKHRQRQKEELEYLKKKVSDLQKQLDGIKKRKKMKMTPEDIYAWEKEAKMQNQKRQKSQEENGRLKSSIIEQMKFANVLQHLFREVPTLSVLPRIETTVHRPLHKATGSFEERMNYLHSIIDREYQQLSTVLTDVGLANTTKELRTAKLLTKTLEKKEILEIQIVRHRIYHYVNYETVANAAWTIISGQFDPKDLKHESPLMKQLTPPRIRPPTNSSGSESDGSPTLHVCYPTEISVKEDSHTQNNQEEEGELSDDLIDTLNVDEEGEELSNQTSDKEDQVEWYWSENDEKESKITIMETIDQNTLYIKRDDLRLVRLGGKPVESYMILKRYYEQSSNRQIIIWTSVLDDDRYPRDPSALCGNQTGRLVLERHGKHGKSCTLKLVKTFTPPLESNMMHDSLPPGVVTEAIMKMVMDQARRLEFILEILTKNKRSHKQLGGRVEG